jgi:hypothetical protein
VTSGEERNWTGAPRRKEKLVVANVTQATTGEPAAFRQLVQ